MTRKKSPAAPRAVASPTRLIRRKKPPRKKRSPATQAITVRAEGAARPRSSIDPLLGDLPGVTLADEQEVLSHFERVEPRLAEAWRRDVVVPAGPITLRRVMYPASFGGATHYAYVDRRLLWYLHHDPSDPIGARWDGYLASPGDAPLGTIAAYVGRDVVVKKMRPQLPVPPTRRR